MSSSCVCDLPGVDVDSIAPRGAFPDPYVLPARDAVGFDQYAAPFLPFLEYHGLGAEFLRERYARTLVAAVSRPSGPSAIVAEATPSPAAGPSPELVLRPSSRVRADVLRRALYLLALRGPVLAFPGVPCAVSFAPDQALEKDLVAAGFRALPSGSAFRVLVAPGTSRA